VSDLVPLPAHGRRFSADRPVRLGDVSPRGRLRLDAVVRYLQDTSSDDTADSALEDADGWVVRRTVVEVSTFPVLRAAAAHHLVLRHR
jgi:acyl-ACP thioesterase